MSTPEYKLIKLLDQGTTGEVYLTSKLGSSQLFATKKIPRLIADKPLYKKYLVSEISLLREIHHKNIIKLENVKQTENDYFIITEYVNGGNLKSCLKQYKIVHGKNFPEEVVQHLMRQIIDAVKYLHSINIIHRDLKLDNIMLNFSNEEDKNYLNILKAQVKIIDFGFATKLNITDNAISVVGSPFNMDPILLKKYNNVENYRKFGYGPEADIWSLGALCYQMLIGETAFDGFTMEELLQNIEVGNYTLPTSLSKEAVSFINSMLQYEGNKRLSADELSNHMFLVKNIQDFNSINVDQISRKVNGDQIMINIKKNTTIWNAFNKNLENELNSINESNLTDYSNFFINKSFMENTNNLGIFRNSIKNVNYRNTIVSMDNFDPFINDINTVNNVNNVNNVNTIKKVTKINHNYQIDYSNNNKNKNNNNININNIFNKRNLRNRISNGRNINNVRKLVHSQSTVNYNSGSVFGKILGDLTNRRNNVMVNNNRRDKFNDCSKALGSIRYRKLPVYTRDTNPFSGYYTRDYYTISNRKGF